MVDGVNKRGVGFDNLGATDGEYDIYLYFKLYKY